MAPSLIASYYVQQVPAGTAAVTTPSFTPANGEVIVVKLGNWDTAVGMNAPTGGGQTYTSRIIVAPGGFKEWCGIYTAVISGSPGSMTVSSTPVASSQYSMVVERWSSATLAGSPATNSGGTTSGLGAAASSLTTTAANSVLSWVSTDVNSKDPATRAYIGSATDEGVRDGHASVDGVEYFAYQAVATAGSTSFGLTAPLATSWTIAGIEVLDAAPVGGARAGAAVLAGSATLPPGLAPRAVVLVSRDVTPLQLSAQPAGPRVTRPTLPVPGAPAALIVRRTADPSAAVMLPLVLDDRAAVVRPVPAPPALLARSVDVTPLQPSSPPTRPLVAPVLRGPSPAALPVLVDVPALVETVGLEPVTLGRAPAQPAVAAPSPVLTRPTADPAAPSTDTPPVVLVARALPGPQSAPPVAVYVMRDVTPLQPSASPPLVAVVPAGRPPAGPVAAVTARSTADPVLDTRTPLLAVQLAQAPAVPARPWTVRVTFDAPPPVTLPRPLVAPALTGARPAPAALLEAAVPPPGQTPPRPLVVRVLLAPIAAARALLGRSPFDGTAPPLVVKVGRATAGTRRGVGADAGTRAAAAASSRAKRSPGADAGTRTGPGATASTKRRPGADGGS